MAAPTSINEIFRQSISSVFKGWTGLQLAVQNGYGGPHSMVKAEWMIEAIFNWFMENDGIHPDELEEFIAEILNNEFDTIAEDGSIQQICQRICLDFDSCRSGNTEVVVQRIQRTLVADVQSSVPVQGLAEDMDDDEPEAAMPDHNVQVMFDHVNIGNQDGASQQSASSSTEGTGESNVQGQQDDDDGWTVVSRKR